MSTLITEAFGGTLGNWSGPGSPATYCSIVSGALSFSGEGFIRHNTSAGTGNKWLRLRFPNIPGSQLIGLGIDSSGNAVGVNITNDGTRILIGDATHYTTWTTWASDEGLSQQGTGLTYNSANYVGFTFDKANKTIRMWNAVTADAPASITEWDSRAADATQTFTGTIPGDYIGLGSYTGSPSNLTFDDLTAGDFAAGGQSNAPRAHHYNTFVGG